MTVMWTTALIGVPGLLVLAVTGFAWYSVRRSQREDSSFDARAGAVKDHEAVNDHHEHDLVQEAAVSAGTGDGNESRPATNLGQTLALPQPPIRPVLPPAPPGSAGPMVALSPLDPAGLTSGPARPALPAASPRPLTAQPVSPAGPRPVAIASPNSLPAVPPGPATPPDLAPSTPRRAHTLRFDSAGETSPGPRSRNDDTWLVRHHLLVIADGVGGKPAGKTAADLAVRTLRDTVDTTAELPERELVSAVELAHYAIVEQSRRDPTKTEMACTLDAVTLHPDGLVTGAHVGDSRVYCLPRDSAVVGLTTDEAVEGALLQSLGGITTQVEPRTWQRPAHLGDRLVLATDGLWSALDDAVVTALIAATGALAPPVAARVLVDTGLGAGATDNVTVVVADVVALDPR